ncbi:HlyD family type I secretion periplasmic adaptor subunit [Aliiroseovarius sp. KMU-50]|uniref:Membrane fusion protein (MFP) family protein n=1 Tax=Aliiroseovarius salicola TaxID=3009082 RepID=A0ABT4W1G6_9RHOB|nr:HlyD family type I secretion periplasmic adaptor subunit [Aliiroseovarius sp. KMU-50]MDA5094340.1 HlyD family type I secretion periplasmic adaptor subunit [Aliiroseovarius sp. KMU-50]
MKNPAEKKRRTWNSRAPMVLSVMSIALLVGLLGVWAARANIGGAVIGAGTVEVSQTMTALQHPVGGVVEELLVTNGDQVSAGDVVVRLEDVKLRSDLNVVEDNLFEILANIARLEAEIDDREEMELHPVLVQAAAQRPEIQALVQRQERRLAAHFEALTTEVQLLDEQVVQVKAQIVGLDSQIEAKETEKSYIDNEIAQLQVLAQKGLLKMSDMFRVEKSLATVSGEIGRLIARIAELRGKISEIELKRHTVAPKARKLAVTELSKLRPERTKYIERRATILDGLTRLDIRAPISGNIHDIKVLGLRSVVVAAKPLMMIVPDSEPALVLVKISATDIDQVYVGQEASLKFKAFNLRHVPIVLGHVSAISADVFTDPRTRKSYYNVSVALLKAEVKKLGGRELLQGMPVEAFLSTDSRTPLEYVLKPLMTYLDRAFRDA